MCDVNVAVYPDGRVCISILHEAKQDVFNQQEKMSEKWRPILGVRINKQHSEGFEADES